MPVLWHLCIRMPRRLVEENPGMLDVEQFKAALEEARRVVPGIDVQQASTWAQWGAP